MPTAHFTITGEFMTRQARDFVREDNPGKAYRLIADGLGGSDAAIAAAIGIVTGKAKLTGDSVVGVDLVDDTSTDADTYLKDVKWLYAGRVHHRGHWVRPTGVITAWGYADAKHAGFKCADKCAFARARAQFYAPDGAFAELAYVPRDLECQPARERWVVFEPCGEPPQWIRPARDLDETVASALESGRGLMEFGPDPKQYERPTYLAKEISKDAGHSTDEGEALLDAAYAAEDAALAAQCQAIGERVRSQAADDVFEMKLGDGRVVNVPRAPFEHWALRRLPEPPELPVWETIAPPGIKMANDDPYHTDWVLGSGLTIEDGYSDNVNKAAWSHASRLQFQEVDDDTE